VQQLFDRVITSPYLVILFYRTLSCRGWPADEIITFIIFIYNMMKRTWLIYS